MRYNPELELEFQLTQILNDGIEFGDNIRGGLLEIETTAAEQRIIHNLGFTPVGFIVIMREGQVDVWASNLLSWTKDVIFLTSDVASVTVRLFVL